MQSAVAPALEGLAVGDRAQFVLDKSGRKEVASLPFDFWTIDTGFEAAGVVERAQQWQLRVPALAMRASWTPLAENQIETIK